MTTAQALGELMTKYTALRNRWIATFGTDNGFNEWFTKQATVKA